MFGKIFNYLKSKTFLYILLICFALLLSVLFYIYSPLFAFNDIYIFSSALTRIQVLIVVWLLIFFIFLYRPLIHLIQSLKNEKHIQYKEIKQEVTKAFRRAKRNYFIALNDAKSMWKRKLYLKNIPLVIIIGNEGAGKSSFINYANIQYPLSESLTSYKKFHKSTNNFNLYISQKGALLDTEGNYFAQENFRQTSNTDEIAEDNLEKNKDFLIKKGVWNQFLHFLNTNTFHSKLNGIVLIIDVHAFLQNPKQYEQNVLQYLSKRVSDCEENLGLQLPIYIVFNKIDLLEGMRTYWDIFDESIANKMLGLTLDKNSSKLELQNTFTELSNSLLYTFMRRNQSLHSLEDKNLALLFLKQLDVLFALAIDFILQAKEQNAFKNKSYIRGVYFTSAYQENVPRNYLLDAVCEKYEIKKPPAKSATKQNKRSYFVQGLLEHIFLKDAHLSSMIKTSWQTFRLAFGTISICIFGYVFCTYLIHKTYKEVDKSHITFNSITSLLANTSSYEHLTLQEKTELMLHLKAILKNYPSLFEKPSIIQYFSLNFSYQGFLPARDFYYAINEEVIGKTLLREMEQILLHNTDQTTLIETIYMYQSLYDEAYINKPLLANWVIKNWQPFAKYKIPKDDFITAIEDLAIGNLSHTQPKDTQALHIAKTQIMQLEQQQRIYTIMAFRNSLKKQSFFNLKDKVGTAFYMIFEHTDKLSQIDKTYTKDGLMEFLSNLDTNIQTAIKIESWAYNEKMQYQALTEQAQRDLYTHIISIYLNDYKQRWEELLQAISPKQYTDKNNILTQLQILSESTNPLNSLIKIVNDNTHLNDTLLLNYAYSLGLPSSDIKAQFTYISNSFKDYYDFIGEKSLLLSQIDSFNDIKKQSSTEEIKEILAKDIQNMSAKITEFTKDDTKNIKDKLIYILEGSNDETDAFVELKRNTAMLPHALKQYYNEISTLSWNVIEKSTYALLNNAWKKEVYDTFINDISPFYPFNAYSDKSLPLNTFKDFFGNTGTLQSFYTQYLSKILQKKGNTYVPNPAYSETIKLSAQFISFFNQISNLNSIFDNNNNLTLNFFIQCLDLSSDFSSLDISYNNQTLHYDHTFNPKIQIIIEQFNSSTELRLSVNDYYQMPQYNKIYNGEWAWLRFIKDITPAQNTGNTLYFENNKQWYFDFSITPNRLELLHLSRILTHFNMPQLITQQ
ncbi:MULTISPECIES: type VI secretion system membrane subunit TssM [Helicobacter]|uniref:type VI secretion system membrane subunit TssM n=2 Tax=Helicobacteraceae TaxID=72293 RepID=UPI0025F14D94|nr:MULTISPECIES: type VI secretion system membrane subunit TssM [Helicobacter]